MEKKVTWQAEVKFTGTVEEFNEIASVLEKMPIEVRIPEWKCCPRNFPGGMRIPVDNLLDPGFLKEITHEMPRLNVKYIKGIDGGMRMAHVHIGDEFILLDRRRFKALASQIAFELAGKRAGEVQDYVDVMDPINEISATPITLP
jgi:hypothetical protein